MHERTKIELQTKNEALREAEEREAEEAEYGREIQNQLEEVRNENERLKAELQRKDETLREVSAREAELQRQLEIQKQEEAKRTLQTYIFMKEE